jgi:hypothetical protein
MMIFFYIPNGKISNQFQHDSCEFLASSWTQTQKVPNSAFVIAVCSHLGAGVAQSAYHPTTDWVTGVQSLAEAKDLSSSLCVQTSSEAHPASYPMGTRAKVWLECDAEHSPPFSAE